MDVEGGRSAAPSSRPGPRRLLLAAARAAPSGPPPKRLSGLLRDAATDPARDRVRIGDLMADFADRAFGALVFLFAIPNVVPIPLPGLSALTGIPLMVLTLQLAAGGKVPWLPEWIRDRSFDRADLLRLVERVEPWLLRLERYLRPRLSWLLARPVERAAGALMVLLSVVLFLPIPLGNLLPGLALSLVALAMLERDGVVLLVGTVVAVASLAIVGGVVYGFVMTAVFILNKAL